MKITDPHIIQTGEKKLITALREQLDQETVKTILMERMTETSFASRGGQIVVHDNQIAFRLDFDLQLSGSLLFDRQGNYISAYRPESSALSNEKESNDDMTHAPESRKEDRDVMENDEVKETQDSEEILDDELNHILKESREFWKQKKGF
jgi:hypothetical protein